MNDIRARDRSLPAFFLLVFVLSVPLWSLGNETDARRIPASTGRQGILIATYRV